MTQPAPTGLARIKAPRRALARLLASLPLAALVKANGARADAAPAAPPGDLPPGRVMLTIFLRHDEKKTLGEINAHLKETGWFKKFPPAGVEIIGWYVMMGIGQVVILSLPPEKLREVNVVVESAAWGGYTTEFYPTYDYRGFWEQARRAAG
jgi:hypothetical protein